MPQKHPQLLQSEEPTHPLPENSLNYLLIPPFGILGAAIGTGTAVVVYNLLKVIYVWIRFSMQPFEQRIIYVLATGAITLLVIFQLPILFNIYADIIIRSVLVTAIYLGPVVVFKISEEFNALFYNSLNHIKKIIIRSP